MPRVLEVLMGDRLVGTITNLPGDNNLFVFEQAYAEDRDAPVLSQGFYGIDRALIAQAQARTKAPPFFANLLPEGELRSYIAARGNVNATRDFPLLWLVGEDLPGNVFVRDAEGGLPTEDPSTQPHRPRAARKLRFSLAGVQLKFSAMRAADGGLTIPAHGMGGHWIVKLPSLKWSGVPENEWSMMSFAREVGIEVPSLSLDSLDSIEGLPADIPRHVGRALSIERFDRTAAGARVHIEDFAQVFRLYPGQKYMGASYGSIANALSLIAGADAVAEFVRRLVFSVGIGNADMHLKNWSLIYPDGRTPKLSPAYDYVSTIAFIEDDALALSIAGTKDWSDVSQHLLERFARRAQVPKGVVLAAAREMVERMAETWPRIKRDLPVPSSTVAAINEHQTRIPLFNPRAALAAGAALAQPATAAVEPPAAEEIA